MRKEGRAGLLGDLGQTGAGDVAQFAPGRDGAAELGEPDRQSIGLGALVMLDQLVELQRR